VLHAIVEVWRKPPKFIEFSPTVASKLIFSDLQEDLPAGSKRALAEDELRGTHVAAMNVKRLNRDTADPRVFRDRLAAWEGRVKGAGATDWRTFMDATKLPEYLNEVR
jgi:hypothetical protein